ncbi:MAG: pilin [Patescibacteria group bacterium]
MRKFFFLAFFLFSLIGIFFADPAFADYRTGLMGQLNVFSGEQGAGYGEARDPRVVAGYIIQILLSVLGTLFLIYLVYAGFLIATSRGEQDQIDKGKKTLRTAIIGIIIVLSAYSLTLLVARIASGDDIDTDEPQGDRPAVDGTASDSSIEVTEDPNVFLEDDPTRGGGMLSD